MRIAENTVKQIVQPANISPMSVMQALSMVPAFARQVMHGERNMLMGVLSHLGKYAEKKWVCMWTIEYVLLDMAYGM